MKKEAKKTKPMPNEAFERFENLTKNLISVSNVEVRKKIEEEKRNKKLNKRKAS